MAVGTALYSSSSRPGPCAGPPRRGTYTVRTENEEKDATNNRVLCVFVPGIKGSVLRCDSCKRRSWPPQFLDSSFDTLRRFVSASSTKIERLMNSSETECLMSHAQEVCCVLKEVSVFGGLIKRNVYAKFLENLQKDCDGIGLTSDGQHRRVTLYNFAYDWTRGVRYAAEQLFLYLQSTTGSYSGVALIAHSMGGLVCRYMLEDLVYHNRKLKPSANHLYHKVKLMYSIGTPHYGTVRSLHYLVDPNGGDFTKHCRGVQSLYDMIPFSDLECQIDGFISDTSSDEEDASAESLPAKRRTLVRCHACSDLCSSVKAEGCRLSQKKCAPQRLKRQRSDIFLKKVDREVTVDCEHWKPEKRESRGPVEPYLQSPSGSLLTNTTATQPDNTSKHISYLVDTLCSRFVGLKGYHDRLCAATSVHFALNSSHKPPGCVYVCVNAVGVKSPSSIDKHNRLFRECESGDGVVCSILDKQTEKKLGRPSWLIPSRLRVADHGSEHAKNASKNTYAPVNDTADENKYSVHVSMLNCIDVFRAVREIMAAEIFGSTAASGNWSGKKCLWRTFVDNQAACEVVSSTSATFRRCEITATNLKSGYCVVNVDLDSDGDNNCVDNNSFDIVVVSSTTTDSHKTPRVHRKGFNESTRIRIKADGDWSRVTVILSGHHDVSNVQSLKISSQ